MCFHTDFFFLSLHPVIYLCCVKVGKCKTLHILSVRENELCELPEELGYLPILKVLDIVNNRIKCLPLSFANLDLDALWIDGSQVSLGVPPTSCPVSLCTVVPCLSTSYRTSLAVFPCLV